jgi:hypothetical protein
MFYSFGTDNVSRQTRHKILSLIFVARYLFDHSGLNTLVSDVIFFFFILLMMTRNQIKSVYVKRMQTDITY